MNIYLCIYALLVSYCFTALTVLTLCCEDSEPKEEGPALGMRQTLGG